MSGAGLNVCYKYLCVAQRQKHNGMSWSTSGSSALAQISALILNNQLLSWLNIVA